MSLQTATTTKKAALPTRTGTKNAKTATIPDAFAVRDSLPFFRKGRGNVETSWWNVTPSGDYATDLATGKEYARAFMPMLQFNAGGADLGIIVSHMATAGRDPAHNLSKHRGIDAIALGFMMEIGGSLQTAQISIAIAATAIERPGSDLGAEFVKLVKRGDAMRGLNRGTLFHDPTAPVFG